MAANRYCPFCSVLQQESARLRAVLELLENPEHWKQGDGPTVAVRVSTIAREALRPVVERGDVPGK